MKSSLLKTVLALSLTAISFQAFSSESKTCTSEPQSKWMSEKTVNAKLVAKGFNVKRIKIEDSCYEAYVISKDGKKSELLINPSNGEPVRTESNESEEK